MRKIKLTLEYDGTNYCGWQYQKNGTSIQETVERAVGTMTGEASRITGASRTDAGVHALGQVAQFTTASNIPCDGFVNGLNSMLPQDIRIVLAEEVEERFHARKDAQAKIYRYYIDTSKQPSAIFHQRAWHVPQKLNLKAMKDVAEEFVGKHDFKAFQATGCSVKHAVRTITEFSIKKGKLPFMREGLIIEVTGDGFVRHMVRNIVGTIMEVGRGAIAVEDIKTIIKERKRNKAGACAPACGLYLVKIFY
jgi:tRNA pseudouridine38-40 synthase